jgi:putative hydrolase
METADGMPRDFSNSIQVWGLAVLHPGRGDWKFTVLYSNTSLAHSLVHTHDWVVVIYFLHDSHREGQRTVVTETRGPLARKRVVRGREHECSDHYRTMWTQPSRAT